jgi:large subunit ribosomal protein L35
MPKQKTNKGAKKRFKITATGKVLYKPAGRRHIMSGKKSKLRRQMRRWRTFDGKHDAKDIIKMVQG